MARAPGAFAQLRVIHRTVTSTKPGRSAVTDATTQGYEADPADVEALLDTALGDALDETDPTIRYTLLSKDLVLYRALVERLADERARAVAAMWARGMSFGAIGELLGMSRGRAQQLVERGRGLPEPS